METLLHAGLGNAVAAALFASLVAGFGLVARRPALMHALWIVVLLKLITPPLWSVPVGPSTAVAVAGTGERSGSLAEVRGFEPPIAEPVFDAGAWYEVVPPDSVEVVEAPARRDLPAAEPPSGAGTVPGWRAVVASTWIMGTLVTFGIAAVRVRRFGRLLREARPAPRDVLDRVGELAARLGLSRTPAVRMTPGAVSPMVWALGCRPLLIVPVDLWERLEGPRRDTLLVHELAHLKRGDHWVRCLELLATGLYWWHPVVWLSRRALHEAEEQCCDAWVVWAFPDAGRTYAEALLDTVDFLSGAEPSVPWAASGLGHVRHLKRRLVMILNGTTPRTLSWSGILATLGLCAAMLPLSPSWADEPPGPKTSETAEERAKPSDQADIHEVVVTRVKLGALNSLQKELDDLTAKGDLSKEDKVRRTAIQHAMKELRRALGERSEKADSDSDEPRERDGEKGTDRRPVLREQRVVSTVRVEPATAPVFSWVDSLGEDPKYQELKEQAAVLKSRLDQIQRLVRSPDDPALRVPTKALEMAKKAMAAYCEKLIEEVRKKNADLVKARAELHEQGTELSRKRAEFLEAELRYEETRRRLAGLEGPDREYITAIPRWDVKTFRGSGTDFRGAITEVRPNYPFSSPSRRPGMTDKLIFTSPVYRDETTLFQDESRRISELEKKLDRVLEEVKNLKAEKEPKSE